MKFTQSMFFKSVKVMMIMAMVAQIGSQILSSPVYADKQSYVYGEVLQIEQRAVIQPSSVNGEIGKFVIAAPEYDLQLKELGIINLESDFTGRNVTSANARANHSMDGGVVTVIDGYTVVGYASIEYGVAKIVLNQPLLISQGTEKVLTLRVGNVLSINGANETNRYANIGILDPGQTVSNAKVANAQTLIVKSGTNTKITGEFEDGVVGGHVYRKAMFRVTPQVQLDTSVNNLLSIAGQNEATIFAMSASTNLGYAPLSAAIKQINFNVSSNGVQVDQYKLRINNEVMGSGKVFCNHLVNTNTVSCEFEGIYHNGYVISGGSMANIELVANITASTQSSDQINVALSNNTNNYGIFNVTDAKNAGAGLIRSDLAESTVTPWMRDWFTEAGIITDPQTNRDFTRDATPIKNIFTTRTDNLSDGIIPANTKNISVLRANMQTQSQINVEKLKLYYMGDAFAYGAVNNVKLYVNGLLVDEIDNFSSSTTSGPLEFAFYGNLNAGANSIEVKVDTANAQDDLDLQFAMGHNVLINAKYLPSNTPVSHLNVEGAIYSAKLTINTKTPITVTAHKTSVEQSTILASASSYPQPIGSFEIGGDDNIIISEITLANLINNVNEVTSQTILNNLNSSTDGAVIELYYGSSLAGSAQLNNGLAYISLTQPISVQSGAKANINVVIRANTTITSAGDTNKVFKIGVLSPGTINSGFPQTLITTLSGQVLNGEFKNLIFNNHYLRATTITFADQKISDTSTNNLLSIAGQNEAILFRTVVSANNSKSANLKQLSFKFYHNGVTANNFKLKVDNTVLFASDATCNLASGLVTCVFNSAYSNGLTIAAGGSRKIELVADVSASASYSDYVVTSLNEGTPQDFQMYNAVNAGLVGASVVWSDNAAPNVTPNTLNWFTDAGVEKLPTNSWTFTRESGVSYPSPECGTSYINSCNVGSVINANNDYTCNQSAQRSCKKGEAVVQCSLYNGSCSEVMLTNVNYSQTTKVSNQYTVWWTSSQQSNVKVMIKKDTDQGFRSMFEVNKGIQITSLYIDEPGIYMLKLTPVDDLGQAIGSDVITTIYHQICENGSPNYLNCTNSGTPLTGGLTITQTPTTGGTITINGTGGSRQVMQLNTMTMTNARLNSIKFKLEGLVNRQHVSIHLVDMNGNLASSTAGFDTNFESTIYLTGSQITSATGIYNVIVDVAGSINERFTITIERISSFGGDQVINAEVPMVSPFVSTVLYGPMCGNALLEQNEQCDDGNLLNGDGCNNSCQIETCENGSNNFPVCNIPIMVERSSPVVTTQPVSEPTKPVSIAINPDGSLNITNNNQVVSPTTQVVSPTTQVVSPTTQVVSPTTQVVSPTTQVVSPTTQVVSPTTQVVSPTTQVVSPTTQVVSPTTEPKGIATVSINPDGSISITRKSTVSKMTNIMQKLQQQLASRKAQYNFKNK